MVRQDSELPKIRIGHSWVIRPNRTLKHLIRESLIPILTHSHWHHFTLLAKYRPAIRFAKDYSLWDNALDKLRRKTDSSCESICVDKSSRSTLADASLVEVDEKKSAVCGWPALRTAQRALCRVKPSSNISNEEMYASLREPPPIDILGEKWREKHKLKQQRLLLKVAQKPRTSHTHDKPLPAVVSSGNILRILESQDNAELLAARSAHNLKCTPRKEEPPPLELLSPDWREKHRLRQEKILNPPPNSERSKTKNETLLNCQTNSQTTTHAFITEQVPVQPEMLDLKRKPNATKSETNNILEEAHSGIVRDRLRAGNIHHQSALESKQICEPEFTGNHKTLRDKRIPSEIKGPPQACKVPLPVPPETKDSSSDVLSFREEKLPQIRDQSPRGHLRNPRVLEIPDIRRSKTCHDAQAQTNTVKARRDRSMSKSDSTAERSTQAALSYETTEPMHLEKRVQTPRASDAGCQADPIPSIKTKNDPRKSVQGPTRAIEKPDSAGDRIRFSDKTSKPIGHIITKPKESPIYDESNIQVMTEKGGSREYLPPEKAPDYNQSRSVTSVRKPPPALDELASHHSEVLNIFRGFNDQLSQLRKQYSVRRHQN